MAVASGGTREIVEVTLLAANLLDLFDAVVTIEDVREKERLLEEAEMQRVIEKFATYGTQDAVDPELRCGGPRAPAAGEERP